MGISPMNNGLHQTLTAHQANDTNLFDIWRRSLEKKRGAIEKVWLVMDSKSGLKSHEDFRIVRSFRHVVSKLSKYGYCFKCHILCFKVALYVREVPPHEPLLEIFLCDPPWP